MPNLLFELLTVTADLLVFIFVGYYLIRIYRKEQELERKESRIDQNYHQVVDNALSKERKILEDATSEADQIIGGAEYISSSSKDAINKVLQAIVVDVQKDAMTTSQSFMTNYQESLKQMVIQSLNDFQKIAKELEIDLQSQVKEFHESLLPRLEKELEEYKATRLKEADEMVVTVLKKVSQEVLNKSISIEDHNALLIDSLEKAKKEGVFG